MYTVVIERRVYKDLDRIPVQDVEKIYRVMIRLEQNSRPAGIKKLKGSTGRFRIRQATTVLSIPLMIKRKRSVFF